MGVQGGGIGWGGQAGAGLAAAGGPAGAASAAAGGGRRGARGGGGGPGRRPRGGGPGGRRPGRGGRPGGRSQRRGGRGLAGRSGPGEAAHEVSEAAAFARCLAGGGIAVFPADTVYGLACDPEQPAAVERLYALKRRPLEKPSAVMFFSLPEALRALPELGPRTREAMRRLLPGPVGLLVPNPARRFPLACGSDPHTLGVRVPHLPRFAGVRLAVLQSSANLADGPDARRLEEVPEAIRAAADLVIDGGELPGTPSTMVDLRRYERDG